MGRHVSRIHRSRRVRRLRRVRRGMGLGLVGASLLAGLTAPAWADSVSCASMTVPVLQRINPETSLSIDTTWQQEADNAALRYGYTVDPGIVYKAAWDPGRGVSASTGSTSPAVRTSECSRPGRLSTPWWRPATETRAPGSTPPRAAGSAASRCTPSSRVGGTAPRRPSEAKAALAAAGLEGPRAELLGRCPRPGDGSHRHDDPPDDHAPDHADRRPPPRTTTTTDHDADHATTTTTTVPTTTTTTVPTTTTTTVPRRPRPRCRRRPRPRSADDDHHHGPTTTTTTTQPTTTSTTSTPTTTTTPPLPPDPTPRGQLRHRDAPGHPGRDVAADLLRPLRAAHPLAGREP